MSGLTAGAVTPGPTAVSTGAVVAADFGHNRPIENNRPVCFFFGDESESKSKSKSKREGKERASASEERTPYFFFFLLASRFSASDDGVGGNGSSASVVAFSTLLSLFVVPAFYVLIAAYTRSPGALTRKLEQLERETPVVGGRG